MPEVRCEIIAEYFKSVKNVRSSLIYSTLFEYAVNLLVFKMLLSHYLPSSSAQLMYRNRLF